MSNILRTTCRFVLNVTLTVITKTITFFWKIFRFLLSFLRHQAVNRPRRRPTMISYEPYSRYIGLIRLARYETPEQTFIYANFLNDRWETLFKAVLYEENEANAETRCYMYTERPEHVDIEGIRVPAPVSVAFLEALFDCYHD